MNKRVMILVSTMLCALFTISLVTYTIVGIFSNKQQTPTTEDKETSEIAKDPNGTGSDISGDLSSEVLALNFIVGDEYVGEILGAENYTGSLLTVNSEGKLIASTAGTENVSVIKGSVAYACRIIVYEKGNGSAENPFNIIRAEDLIKLVNQGIETEEYYHYSQRCDLDLSSYESWVPLGKLTTPFNGSYNGNGFAIRNMNINITKDNISDYVDNAQTAGSGNGSMLTAGFFGFVGNPLGGEIAEIKNLNVIDATVQTTEIEAKSGTANNESAEYRESLNLTQSYVGVLAGYVINSNIEGNSNVVSSVINSSLYCDDTTSTKAGVSAFIGGASSSNIKGYEIVSSITSKNAGTVKANGTSYYYYGTTIAGILARNYNSNISDMVVQMEVSAKNYENTVVAGAVGYIINSTNATEVSIKNVQINNLYVSMTTASYFSDKCGIVAGAVGANFNSLCTLENIAVNNIVVYANRTGQVAGLINTNDGIIKNSVVTGFMKGVEVAGVANTNNGSIIWDDSISTYAVDVNLVGKIKVGGVAIYNFGEIAGSESLTQVKASMGWDVETISFDSIKDEAMMAGVAVVNAGTDAIIRNLHTLSYMGPSSSSSDGGVINAGGVVGYFGSYTTQKGKVYEGGAIENVIVNTSIQTIAGEVGEKVYSGKTGVVGGVVAIINETTAKLVIKDVSGNITVNKNQDGIFGLEVYGTIVGVNNSAVEILCSDASLIIEATVFTNYTGAEKQFIGYLIGKNGTQSATVEEKVQVRIAIIETAENAVVGRIN